MNDDLAQPASFADRYTDREKKLLRELGQIEATLAQALGYPWSDEIGGYVTGDHTALTLALEVRARGVRGRVYP